MITTPHVDWFALSPSLTLLGVAALALLAAVLVPAHRRKQVAATVAFGGFAGSFVAAAVLYAHSAAAHGVLEQNQDFAWASGRFQLLCYKEEVEANLRSAGLSGFQLLDLG